MVPELVEFVRPKPQPRLRGRDFSRTSHRAPDTVKRLTQEYNEPTPGSWWQRLRWPLVLLIIILVAGYALLGPTLVVHNIIITGSPTRDAERNLRQMVQAVLTGRYAGIIPRANILFVQKKRIATALGLESAAPELTIERQFPNVLRIRLPVRAFVAVWQSGEAQYIMDQRGILTQPVLPESAAPDLVVVREVGASARTIGEVVAGDSLVEFLHTLPPLWRQILPNIKLDYLEVEAANLPSVKLATNLGWYVLVSSAQPLDPQLNSLSRLVSEKISADEARLEYIDVRFGSKVYYRLK